MIDLPSPDIVAWFVPVPTIPAPVTVTVSDSDAVALIAFLCVTTITAAASLDAAFGANTVASAVADMFSPAFNIDVEYALDAFRSLAFTVTVHVIADELRIPPPPFTVGVSFITYVPATVGASSVTSSLADTAARELLVDETSAVRESDESATSALVVSTTDIVGSLTAPAGSDSVLAVIVRVSPVLAARKPIDTTAVAESPVNTVSATASIVNVSALCTALDGEAESNPKVNAVTVTVATRRSACISFSDFI
jgi:hypothetical protein